MVSTRSDKLNILVYGAGAIGTYLGGSLARTGHRALFLERPGAAADLRSQGLTVELPAGTFQDPNPEVAESLDAALAQGPFDAALFALKSFDTAEAAAAMAAQPLPMPPVLCLQNGVENEKILRETLGPDGVIAGTVTSVAFAGSPSNPQNPTNDPAALDSAGNVVPSVSFDARSAAITR